MVYFDYFHHYLHIDLPLMVFPDLSISQRDDHAAGIRDAALQAVHAHVHGKEWVVVSYIHDHPYIYRGESNWKVEPSPHGRQPLLPS